ncbi:hypothetical protein H1164_03820 [Thermoactinomyces daqus]|uniref:Uncharacterized protein n=1 Tax=Thermoactinomyces daqus TaxID=1329516 RepID=A0A7W1X8M3_9BACL|nr:hypothetical protein [Thermoactinomyces daqus]MBA4542029.1 hypothetical protein [Thermoactinomyces daqus]
MKNNALHSRMADVLYRRFKNDCMEYGLSISEAIEIIIDREIDRLEALKEAISHEFVSPKKTADPYEWAARFVREHGALPSRGMIAEATGASEWTARKARQAAEELLDEKE